MNMKMERINADYDHAVAMTRLLMSNPTFQAAVSTFRTKWNIPANGIEKSAIQDWHQWRLLYWSTYTATDSDRKLELSRQQRIYAASRKTTPFNKWLQLKYITVVDGERAYQNDIGYILLTYKFNHHWYDFIERFLVTGDYSNPPHGVAFHTEIDERSGLPYIAVDITNLTSRDELMEAYPVIKQRQRDLPNHKSKKQPYSQLDLNLRMIAMSKDGLSSRQIAEALNKEKTGDAFTYKDVNNRIASIRKHMEQS